VPGELPICESKLEMNGCPKGHWTKEPSAFVNRVIDVYRSIRAGSNPLPKWERRLPSVVRIIAALHAEDETYRTNLIRESVLLLRNTR